MRLLERGITQARVLECVATGECIHVYPEDTPFPSALFFAFVEGKPLHVVAAFDKTEKKCTLSPLTNRRLRFLNLISKHAKRHEYITQQAAQLLSTLWRHHKTGLHNV
jgi:hypothetical protein